MADRPDIHVPAVDAPVVGFGVPVDGGYAWRWQWTWSTAGASRTW